MPYWILLSALTIPLVLIGFGLAALLVSTLAPRAGKTSVEVLTLTACLAGLLLAWHGSGQELKAGGIVFDGLASVVSILILINTILVILISIPYCRRRENEEGEFLILVLFSSAGMLLMAASTSLLMIFISLEMLSIPLYVLAASERERRASVEAGLKYLLLGSVGSVIFLYGTALLYGYAGSTELAVILEALQTNQGSLGIAALGCGLLLAAVGFKLSAVPFHMWAPDVYQGAPTPIAALIATAAKAAILVPLLRFTAGLVGPLAAESGHIITILCILSMTFGNLFALVQRDAKRMLAYSSVAHAGYLLMAFASPGPVNVTAAVFYIVAYSFMNITAFAVISTLERNGSSVNLKSLRGLAGRSPWLALAFVVSMLALTGIPPTAGFLGKFLLFKSVVDNGAYGLAIIAALNSLIALFYYLRFATTAFLPSAGEPAAEETPEGLVYPAAGVAIALGTLVTLALGIIPQSIIQTIEAVSAAGRLLL